MFLRFNDLEKKLHSGIIQELKKMNQQRETNPHIIIKQVKDTSIFFNSWFESGNLREVEKVSDTEYNLYLNFDFNTLNYTQWYYYSVRNFKKGNLIFAY